VSWQAASFALIGLALLAGFVWYERSRPSSRVLALVATLAGLAALGRIAFAPLPDVKPTTTIVVIAGYTLGGAPGFAIGAIAALASNLFYGQGPWTPWQMLAWGLAGVAGAALARLSGQRLGRVPLALACGLAAAAYGLMLDLSTWITYAGDLTLRRYLLIEGQALAFNVAHVVASIGFFLAFGPALIRMLLRFRARMDVRWVPLTTAILLLMLFLAVPVAASVPPARAAALRAQVGYLSRAQNPDGGFGAAPRQASTQLYTAWAMLGLAAGGGDPSGERRAAAYVVSHQAQLQGTGDRERTVLALAAAGVAPPHALLAALARDQRPNGSFRGQVNLTAFGILALRASGRVSGDGAVGRARRWLARQQNADGGFNFFGRGGASGIDDTAAALEGLVAGGAPHASGVARAAAYLIARQNPDGGFPLVGGGDSNAQSTAWAIQGLLAGGRNQARVRRAGSRTPLGYLESLTARDGSVRYSRTSAQTPVWVTGQALTALAERPFPILAKRLAHRAAARPVKRQRRHHRPSHRPVAIDARTAARLAGLVMAMLGAPLGL
jgi:energy-coupling factor transport system substrate-specific component